MSEVDKYKCADKPWIRRFLPDSLGIAAGYKKDAFPLFVCMTTEQRTKSYHTIICSYFQRER